MKYLTHEEARTQGVILEVNRQLLHPRGLALEISIPSDDETVGVIALSSEHLEAFEGILAWMQEHIQQATLDAGEPHENGDRWRAWAESLQKLISETGREQRCVLTIQDHRDDPEGVYFDDLNANDVERAERFEALTRTTAAPRLEALGYFTQPLPGPVS